MRNNGDAEGGNDEEQPSGPRLAVRTVATDATHRGARNYITTARNVGIKDVEIMGLGDTWGGWPWRTQKHIECLQQFDDPGTLVLITDCYDVMFNGGPADILRGYRRWRERTGKTVLFGAENQCGPRNCAGKVAFDPKAKTMRYVNAGVSMGPAADMLVVWRQIQRNYSRFQSGDDQMVLGKSLLLDPVVHGLVGTDTRQDVVCNLTGSRAWQMRLRFQNEVKAPVLHFPGHLHFKKPLYNHLLRSQARNGGEEGELVDDTDVVWIVLGASVAAVALLMMITASRALLRRRVRGTKGREGARARRPWARQV